MTNVFHCCDDRRREAIRAQSVLNGIDHLEVLDSEAPTEPERQRILRVHFVNAPAPAALTADHVTITGGERVVGIQIESVSYDGEVLVVVVDRAGDFSPYVLRLIDGPSGDPLSSLDPLLAEVTFSFKVECPTELDCQVDVSCPPDQSAEPEIDRLAKDYQSFRRLMLDRMSLVAPEWRDRSAADLGVMLVEALAYTADHLSYTQDAVATEAYLGTARRRTSIRKHARLVDYRVNDGSNARAWVHLAVSSDAVPLPRGTQLLTRELDSPLRIEPGSRAYREALAQGALVFEAMHETTLFVGQNELPFYSWGARECCLPKGATRATLLGHPDLEIGDVLLFEEILGARTGREEDADPTHRHVVRLTRVAPRQDPLGGRFLDPPSNAAVDVTDIAWADADALPFPLCVSSITDPALGSEALDRVSVARGNMVLCDHGRTIDGEDLGVVPPPSLFRPAELRAGECHPPTGAPILPRFRPALREAPLTHVGAVELESTAAAATRWEPSSVLPAVALTSTGALALEWRAIQDLLESDPDTAAFVVEVDDRGGATLRFGDDQYGMRPIAGTQFSARYRIGNGRTGNVGVEAIGRIVTVDPAFVAVRNPLPASGGTDPESLARVRHAAPAAFRTQGRAVTEADWERVTEQRDGVQRARATFRWTGSWYTVFDTVDRIGGLPVDAAYEAELVEYLERFRIVGHDLEIDPPRFVPLSIELCVSIDSDHFRGEVKRALYDRLLPLFHPDRFTFAEAVYLSPIIAAAQSVSGVRAVGVHKFERLGKPSTSAVATGKLPLGRLEIPRLDNDPDYPERGLFKLVLEGGR